MASVTNFQRNQQSYPLLSPLISNENNGITNIVNTVAMPTIGVSNPTITTITPPPPLLARSASDRIDVEHMAPLPIIECIASPVSQNHTIPAVKASTRAVIRFVPATKAPEKEIWEAFCKCFSISDPNNPRIHHGVNNAGCITNFLRNHFPKVIPQLLNDKIKEVLKEIYLRMRNCELDLNFKVWPEMFELSLSEQHINALENLNIMKTILQHCGVNIQDDVAIDPKSINAKRLDSQKFHSYKSDNLKFWNKIWSSTNVSELILGKSFLEQQFKLNSTEWRLGK